MYSRYNATIKSLRYTILLVVVLTCKSFFVLRQISYNMIIVLTYYVFQLLKVCFNLLILIFCKTDDPYNNGDNNANLPSSVRHDNHLYTIIKGKSLLFIHHRIIIQQIIVYLTRHRLSNYLLHYHCQIRSHHKTICIHFEPF